MSAPPDNTRSSAVQQAADWLRVQTPRPSPLVPALRERFGLTPKEVVQAIRATLQQGRAQ